MKADELLSYYEKELSYLRHEGEEFAHKYKKIAARLALQSQGSADPHVERLIEAFAFLTARIRRKIDDEFPELTEALLSVIEPQFLAPLPSMAIAQLKLNATQGKCTEGQVIPRHTTLLSPPINGNPCRFRTCLKTTLWPIDVASMTLSSPRAEENPPQGMGSVLRLELACDDGVDFSELDLDQLSFFIHGGTSAAYGLYEYICRDIHSIAYLINDGSQTPLYHLPSSAALSPCGFEMDEGPLPYSKQTPLAHRLLLEYFAFPQKFLFFTLNGLRSIAKAAAGHSITLLLYSKRRPSGLSQQVKKLQLRLGCSPIVNIFSKTTEPIRVNDKQSEYRVIPDRFSQNDIELYTIESVRGIDNHQQTSREYRPFYAMTNRSQYLGNNLDPLFYASRRPSHRKDGPDTDTYLTLSTPEQSPMEIRDEVLRVSALCTNHNLPATLPFGENRSDFSIEQIPLDQIICLTKPTPTVQCNDSGELQWRLLALLSLNHLSVSDTDLGLETLKETLSLFDLTHSDVNEQLIAGVSDLSSNPIMARVTHGGVAGFARGMEIRLELDPSAFVGSSMYLLAAVLERFYGLSAPINTFTKLVVTLKNSDEILKKWPPRAGERPLL